MFGTVSVDEGSYTVANDGSDLSEVTWFSIVTKLSEISVLIGWGFLVGLKCCKSREAVWHRRCWPDRFNCIMAVCCRNARTHGEPRNFLLLYMILVSLL